MKRIWLLRHICCFMLIVSSVHGVAQSPEALKNHLQEWLKEPEVLAFLDVIAFAEGTYRAQLKGYKMRYPSKTFTDYSQHPGIVSCAQLNGRRVCATAAGRYMFLQRTWDSVMERLNLENFSPLSQDIAAVYLLWEQKVLDAIKNREFESVVRKLNTIWATFPGAPFDQPTKKMAALRKIFDQRLAHYQAEMQK